MKIVNFENLNLIVHKEVIMLQQLWRDANDKGIVDKLTYYIKRGKLYFIYVSKMEKLKIQQPMSVVVTTCIIFSIFQKK